MNAVSSVHELLKPRAISGKLHSRQALLTTTPSASIHPSMDGPHNLTLRKEATISASTTWFHSNMENWSCEFLWLCNKVKVEKNSGNTTNCPQQFAAIYYYNTRLDDSNDGCNGLTVFSWCYARLVVEVTYHSWFMAFTANLLETCKLLTLIDER